MAAHLTTSAAALAEDRGELISLVACLGNAIQAEPEAFYERPLQAWPEWISEQGFDSQCLIDWVNAAAQTSNLSTTQLHQFYAEQAKSGCTTASFLAQLHERSPQFVEALRASMQELGEEAESLQQVAGGTSALKGHPYAIAGIGVVCGAAVALVTIEGCTGWRASRAIKKQFGSWLASAQADGKAPLKDVAVDEINYLQKEGQVKIIEDDAGDAIKKQVETFSSSSEIASRIERDAIIYPIATAQRVKREIANRSSWDSEAASEAGQIVNKEIVEGLNSSLVETGLTAQIEELHDEKEAIRAEWRDINAAYNKNQEAIEKAIEEYFPTNYDSVRGDCVKIRDGLITGELDPSIIVKKEYKILSNTTLFQGLAAEDTRLEAEFAENERIMEILTGVYDDRLEKVMIEKMVAEIDNAVANQIANSKMVTKAIDKEEMNIVATEEEMVAEGEVELEKAEMRELNRIVEDMV